jgi:hypothetical protein
MEIFMTWQIYIVSRCQIVIRFLEDFKECNLSLPCTTDTTKIVGALDMSQSRGQRGENGVRWRPANGGLEMRGWTVIHPFILK